MRILAISHSCVIDVNQELFVELARLPGVELQLVIPAEWKSEYTNEPIAPRLLDSVKFPVHFLPVWAPGHVSLHCYRRLPLARLRDYRPEVILSSQEPWSLSGLQAIWLAKRLKCPFVFQTNQNIYKRYPPPFAWIEQLSYTSAAHALAYSEGARQVLIQKGCQRPASVVPYGTDLSLFYPADSEHQRQRLNLGKSLVIGYMGRIRKEKGLDTVIDSLGLISQRCPDLDCKVLFVGSGDEEGPLRAHARRLQLDDRIVFGGPIAHDQAGAYLRCMDVFVLPSRTTPSWKEQFGRVIIEALACGIPVVGSDSGEIPHLIRRTNGGLVFCEGEAEDLAANLLPLLLDGAKRRAMGRQGSDAVRQHYTYGVVARQLRDVLANSM